MVIVLPRENLAVRVISINENREKKAKKPRCEWNVCIDINRQTLLYTLPSIDQVSLYWGQKSKKRWKKSNHKCHRVWQEPVYLWENGGISEHLISFSPVQGVHLRLESCLWERPVICATVHMSITIQFYFAYKQDLIKTELHPNKMLSWHCNKASDHECKGFLKHE